MTTPSVQTAPEHPSTVPQPGDFAIIVPARLASVRFPKKLLAEVGGLPLILHTGRRLRNIAPEWPLHFATDGSPELRNVLEGDGFSVIETDPDLPSGTDRLAAANRQLRSPRVLNVQADEPLVSPAQLDALRRLLSAGWPLATVACPFPDALTFANPSKVKVVCAADGRALYFSRAGIPFSRAHQGQFTPGTALWHQGLYGYTAAALQQFTQYPPSPLEATECLEQLRALYHGLSMAVATVPHHGLGIDTPQDLEKYSAIIRR